MRPKANLLDPAVWVDVLEHLHQMRNRKAMRSVLAWVRGPLWIPTASMLEAYRTSMRGQVRNLRTGVSTPGNSLSGEISVRSTPPSEA